MMTNNVWAVIRREYLQRVRSKWFIIGTIGGPIFMAALMFVPVYFAARSEANERVMVVVDQTGVLYERLAPRLEDGGYTVNEEPWSDDLVADLTQRVMDDDLGGFMILDDATLSAGVAQLSASQRPSAIRSLSIRQALVASALEHQLEGAGVDAVSMLQGGALNVTVLTENAMDQPAQVGLSFVDVAIAHAMYLRAVERGVGQTLTMQETMVFEHEKIAEWARI